MQSGLPCLYVIRTWVDFWVWPEKDNFPMEVLPLFQALCLVQLPETLDTEI